MTFRFISTRFARLVCLPAVAVILRECRRSCRQGLPTTKTRRGANGSGIWRRLRNYRLRHVMLVAAARGFASMFVGDLLHAIQPLVRRITHGRNLGQFG